MQSMIKAIHQIKLKIVTLGTAKDLLNDAIIKKSYLGI